MVWEVGLELVHFGMDHLPRCQSWAKLQPVGYKQEEKKGTPVNDGDKQRIFTSSKKQF